MATAVAKYHQYLDKKGQMYYPKLGVCPPVEINDAELLASLEKGGGYQALGVTPDELYVNYSKFCLSLPCGTNTLTYIVRNINNRQILHFKYVRPIQGFSAKWMTAFPLGLEQINGQWYLLAINLDTPTPQLAHYNLAFILEISKEHEKPPKVCKKAEIDDHLVTVEIVLNPALTSDQKLAFCRELGIVGNKLKLPARALAEFQQLYMRDAQYDSIYPILHMNVVKEGKYPDQAGFVSSKTEE